MEAQRIVLVSSIEATRENAVAIQRLTLQDVTAGGFKNPKSLADPDNEALVDTQLKNLKNHPKRYSGFMLDGKLVAYMKLAEWKIGDEWPFATGVPAITVRLKRLLRLSPSTGQLGIFGLVASSELTIANQRLALAGLLAEACKTHNDIAPGVKFVNIIMPDNDPLMDIARSQGFVASGKRGEAAGAPGKMQRRYVKRLGAW